MRPFAPSSTSSESTGSAAPSSWAPGRRTGLLRRAAACLLALSFTSCSSCGGGSHALASVYYLSDRLGGPTVLTDASGKLLAQSNDDPWGKQLVADSEPYGFAGKERDSEAGLYDFGARFYDLTWLEYIVSNTGESNFSSASASSLIRRIGCSLGTRCAG